MLLCLFLALLPFALPQRPTVKIPQGYLIGTKVYGESGRIVDTFLGIPYASAPIGPYRFTPPQRHFGWNGTLQAFNYGPNCPQLPITADNLNENCLYLNVWAPENAIRNGPVPVVVVFEGVEFSKNNEVTIPGQEMAMEGVVIVTVNYRMNVFGFLCLGTQDVRGNFGLIDQYVALIWVRENIHYFGGDSEKITLFGYSGGAASVVYHMISPRTSGLFKRAIMSSGSILSPWHTPNNNFAASERIVKILGCYSTYTRTMMQCLKSKSTQDILRAYEEYTESGKFPDLFLPVVDAFLPESDRYLPVEPLMALRDGTYLQVPILVGVSKPVSDPRFRQWTELASQGFSQLQQYIEQSKIPDIIHRYQFSNASKMEIAEVFKWRYISSSEGDVRVLLNQLKTLNYEAKVEAPHFLQLNYLVSTFMQPIYVYDLDDIGFFLNDTASLITSDLLLLFGPLLLNQIGRRRFTPQEMAISKRLKQLWTNFIRFGNPTPSNNAWRRYVSNEYYVETFDTSSNSYTDQIKKFRRISFWTQLLPRLSQIKYSTRDDPRELHSSLDPAAGFRHAMYTLIGLVVALLALLLVCIVLLKRRNKENERQLHMGY